MSAVVALAAVALVARLAVRLARRRWVVVTVTGSSMAPTLRDGQRLLARRVRAARGPLVARGAVVVFRLPPHLVASDDPDQLTLRIKRAAAVADDPLPPAYRAEPWAAGSTHVPRGMLVVAGDNPLSQGSRELGFVDEADVIAVLAISASLDPDHGPHCRVDSTHDESLRRPSVGSADIERPVPPGCGARSGARVVHRKDPLRPNRSSPIRSNEP